MSSDMGSVPDLRSKTELEVQHIVKLQPAVNMNRDWQLWASTHYVEGG